MKKCFSALIFAIIAISAFLFQHNLETIIRWMDTLGVFAPLFFLIFYCLATLCFLPTMVLTLAGGVLFGPILGTVFNLTGATIGAAFAFCISRHLAFDWVARNKNVRLSKLMAGVDNWGWQFIALVRILPIIPFNVVNYGLGVTQIKFSHYIITTAIFLIPTEIFFTYCGYAGMDILNHPHTFYKGTRLALLFGVCAGLVIYFILNRYRRYLAQRFA